MKSDVDVASISSSQKTFTTFLIMWKKKWGLFWTVCYIPPNYPFPDFLFVSTSKLHFYFHINGNMNIWPSQWGVPLIPEWIPSRRQCTSLRRLLITLMFVLVMLCPILFNGKRWVRNDHNGKHTPLNVLNPLTDFEKPLTETIYLTCSII